VSPDSQKEETHLMWYRKICLKENNWKLPLFMSGERHKLIEETGRLRAFQAE
jgi:hypothetical protein